LAEAGAAPSKANPNRQIRSLVLSVDLIVSRRNWAAYMEASSIWTAPDGCRRIVWMIKGQLPHRSARQQCDAGMDEATGSAMAG
jgi:hypothetical protein